MLALLFALAAAAPQGSAESQPVPVVVVSIDGLAPEYVTDADRYGLKIPNLRRLLSEGASARLKGVVPTVTYASHTTLVTGVSPARHGIVDNHPFDPLGRNKDGWYWYAEDIRVPTLWDAATDAGYAVSAVDWPVTVGARMLWCIPQFWRSEYPESPDDHKLSRLLSSPGLLAEAEREVGAPYPSGYAYEIADDRRRAAFSEWIVEERRPRLHFAYFSALDEVLHRTSPGSPEALAVLEELDEVVGKLREAALEAGGGRAVFAVVSDHGHSRTTRELRLNEALREAGLILLDERGKVTDWKAMAWGSGGSAAILLKDPKDDAARLKVDQVLDALAALPDTPIQRILDKDHAREAGGFPQAAWVVGVKVDVRIATEMAGETLRVSVPKGSHGHLPENAEMDASFLLVGPGVPAGQSLGRVDMRDVAPTLATFLGLKMPKADGHDLLAPGKPR